MRQYLIGMAVLAGSALGAVQAQSVGNLVVPKRAQAAATHVQALQTPAALPGGGGLISPGLGKDDCTDLPMDSAGTGAGLFSFDTIGATIGATNPGQIEVLCSFGGATSIQSDVWLNWTSDFDGQAVLSTVGFTTLDTKIAVYPDTGGCPANGTALACNDDVSGAVFQSMLTWTVTNGTTYTLQIGQWPGGATWPGGTGQFDISAWVPPPCGTKDSGASDNAMALTDQTHDFIWMKEFDCLATVESVSIVFSALIGGTTPPGTPYDVLVWEDLDADGDGNPTTGVLDLLLTVTGGTVVAASTDVYETTTFAAVTITGTAYVGIKMLAANWAGSFPAGVDDSTLVFWPDDSLYAGGVGVDPSDIITTAVYFETSPFNFMLRATGTKSGGSVGVPFCFGDGSDGASCPCGNIPAVGSAEGCVNVSGVGAYLTGTGIPSVGTDALVLEVHQAAPSDFGIFAQNIAPGTPFTFYNGAFCLPTDGHLVRHYNPPAVAPTVTDATGSGVNAQPMTVGDFLGDTQPGVTIWYQFWGRDNGGPCGAGANFSAGLSVTWLP